MSTLSHVCRFCKTTFQAPAYKGKRVYCGRVCQAKNLAKTRKTTKGFVRTAKGYIARYQPDHPMAMTTGYVLEHRAVAAEMIGRLLVAHEVVDHINGIRDDNRRENLRVMTKKAHDAMSNRGRVRMARCPNCDHHFPLKGRVDSAGQTSLKAR